MTNKYGLYIRKSSEGEDRQIASLDSQETVLKEIAAQRKIKIAECYAEAKSAKNPGRKLFNKMMRDIDSGKIDSIICWKLDRLARNPVDGGELIWKLTNRQIKEIITSDRTYYPDDNVIMMYVEFGMANQFVRDLGKNTKRGMLSKAERGYMPSLAPIGYMPNPHKSKGNREIIIDPERFDLVRRLFDMYLSEGYSVSQIHAIAVNDFGLTTRSGRTMAKSNMFRIFKDPFYYGEFEFPKRSGNWYKGKHDAMITKNEYDKIQKLLTNKSQKRPSKKSFKYTGFMKCGECGRAITAESKTKKCKNGNVHKYIYYHCNKTLIDRCSQGSIEEKVLESQIQNILERIYLPPRIIEWANKQLALLDEEARANSEERISALSKQISQLNKKKMALLDLLLNKTIDNVDYQLKKNDLEQSISNMEATRDSLLRTDPSNNEGIQTMFEIAKSAVRKFSSGGMMDKRLILSAIQSNLSIIDKKLHIQLKKPLSLIGGAVSKIIQELTEKCLIEPTHTLINIDPEVVLGNAVVHLYAREDSNP